MEKSKIQSAIDKCQNLLKFFTEKVSENFEGIKVKDSEMLVDYGAELVAGATVNVSSYTGSETAPEGEYELVNGAIFTVKDGKVESILQDVNEVPDTSEMADEKKEDDEEVFEDSEEPVGGIADDEVGKLQEKVNELEELIKALTESIKGVPTQSDLKDFHSDLKNFNHSIEALAKVPTQLSADSRVEVKDSEMDKYKKIAALYSK